ncbi:hypothetical protein SCUP234_10704 [Seiridium cupressi]
MQFPALFVTIFAFVSLGRALPSAEADYEGILEGRDTYDKKGSGMCSSLQVKFCDEAVNNYIIRDDAQRYKPDVYQTCSGGCSALGLNGWTGAGCRVFVQGGQDCKRSGNQLWHDYQDIRNNGVDKCGSKHWGNGCLTTINYVSECGKVKEDCPRDRINELKARIHELKSDSKDNYDDKIQESWQWMGVSYRAIKIPIHSCDQPSPVH